MRAAGEGSPLSGRQGVVWLVFLTPLALAACVYAFSLLSLFKLAVVGLAVLIFSLLVLLHPKWGLLAAVYYVYSGATFYFPFHLSYWIAAITLVPTLLALCQGDKIQLKDRLFSWSLAMLVILSVQSTLFSYDFHYSLRALFELAKAVVIVFLITQLLRSRRDLEHLTQTMLVGALAAVVLGLVNIKLGLIRNVSIIGEVSMLRFTGTYANPNNLGMSLVSTLPLAVFWMKNGAGMARKMAAGMAVIVLLLAVFATFSRAAFLSLTLVLVMILMREAKAKLGGVILLLTVTAVVILTPKYYWYRLGSLLSFHPSAAEDWSLYLRFWAMRVAWDLFAAHPFTGVGINNFIVRSASHLYFRIVVHNVYLEILAGTGLFGLIALLLTYFRPLQLYRRHWRSCPSRRGRDLAFYLMTALVSVLVGALFFSEAFTRMIWIPLSAGLVIGRSGEKHD